VTEIVTAPTHGAPSAHPSPHQESLMQLPDLVRLVRRSWWLVALVTALGLGVAVVADAVLPPRWVSTAQVYVVVRAGGQLTSNDLVQGSTAANQKVHSYVDIATTDRVLGRVVDDLGLDVSSQELARSVSVESPEDTALLRLSASADTAEGAARIADAVSRTLATVVDEIENVQDDGAVRLEIVQEADVPSAPEAPRPVVDVGLGVLLGLLAGVGLAVLRGVVDTRVRDGAQAAEAVGAPVIASVAFDPDSRRKPLVVHDDPRDPRAESYRSLRTNLRYADVDGRLSSLVVTSPNQSEGKTTVACNLALALADGGARVVLVDADLRRPQVAERMGLEGAAGLTDVLIGRVELDDVLQPWGRSALSVLPSGAVPPNPSELLDSQGMATLLDHLSATFDHVVIDAPPVLPVTDAAVLSTLADGAVMVVAANRTKQNDAVTARATLDRVQGRVLGTVLTMVPTRGPDAAAARGYYDAGPRPTRDPTPAA